MPHLLRISAVLTLPLLASLLAVAPAGAQEPGAFDLGSKPEAPTSELGAGVSPSEPKAPTAPTCKKKVSKQVMSGGVVKTVMVDNGTCLKEWEAYSEAFGGWPPGGDAASPTLGTMKWIPAGTFTMGSPASEAGRDRYESQYETTLTRGFWLMEHEVTQGEWQAVMRSNPSSFPSCGPTCPVEKVSWHEAVWFAKLASARDGVAYRLPTDSEWEIAARGGQSYVYAGSNKATSVGWIWDNSGSTTHAVCQKARNGYGLCDMTGNVQEWITWNGISEYRRVRGGSWSGALWNTRVAYGNSGGPQSKQDDLGFRLARTSP
jgi:formylglycine-generating enzyme required for sulfatase activity